MINMVFTTLAINWGTTHFISWQDVIVRGIFIPLIGILAVVGIYKTHQEMKDIIAREEYFEDDEEDENMGTIEKLETKPDNNSRVS